MDGFSGYLVRYCDLDKCPSQASELKHVLLGSGGPFRRQSIMEVM